MSDTASRGPVVAASSEDRILATVIYVLYFVAPFFCGLTGLVGAVVAYVRRPLAQGLEQSHYAFQIRILWTVLAIFLLALVGAAIGVLLLIGQRANGMGDYFEPTRIWRDAAFTGGLVLVVVSGLALVADVLWLMLASVFGVARLLSNEPIGRIKA
jgi:uncharacterized membrane protein